MKKTSQPISTSSAESEDSRSPRSGQDLKPSPSANQILGAERSLKSDGDSQSILISEPLMPSHTQESLFSPADHRANQPVEPGSKEAKAMSAGSGRKLCACLRKQSRIASFSRTLLESSTWGSTEYFLRWEGSATKCNASIFRLVPWTRPNSDTESGSSVSDHWATPSACVPNLGEKPETWLVRAAKLKEKHGNGNGAGIPLSIQVQRVTWPTLHGTAKEEYERRQGPTANELGNLVNRTAASMAAARCERSGQDEPERGPDGRSSERGESLVADTERERWERRRISSECEEGWRPQCSTDGLRPERTAWSNSVWVPCADGKLRRAPDDSFDLVDGLHRSLLAALGNSICPQVAYEILKAVRGLI